MNNTTKTTLPTVLSPGRWAVLLAALIAAVLLFGPAAARAQDDPPAAGANAPVKPSLREINTDADKLKSAYITGKTYNLRLEYRGDNRYPITKAEFVDESAAGQQRYKAKEIPSGGYENGAVVVWEIVGFEQGAHRGFFEVTNEAGDIVRYPGDKNDPYRFKVEALMTKWIIFVVGLLVGVLFVPFLFYLAARAINPRGNPSSVARGGLLVGILASLALFIYQFVGVFDLLILVIAGVAALALLIIVLTRR